MPILILKTTKELMLKIRGALKYAYARGLISNDFGHLLKAKGKDLEKKNVPLSITELKNLDIIAYQIKKMNLMS